ncbi:NADH:flavin oxidoreductase NADH oxidase family protein [Stachybotrys elegans]|uniref:NADH:flavin oxidoreductase NADH oxidase family protein n=1 Tax=Stachybotrys elegans TaxID=80388 RepID=A0A8K0WPK3_9HYPO|nr:NADH:flavin oxidoreductase NADH oxidase family protein [Stachybotrys elegans]
MLVSSTSLSPAESKLFKPITIGTVELNHRVALAPLSRYRNDDEGVPLPYSQKYYADRAAIPGTLIISEATGVSHPEEPNGSALLTKAQIEAWKRNIDAVHSQGSFFFQQIWSMGRAGNPEFLAEKGLKYRSSSAIPLTPEGPVPEAMTEQEILDTIQDFVTTAKRAVELGADGVEIHGAHGYLIHQFLSDKSNIRTDRWGGSVENRSRFLLEIVKALVAAIGAERLGIRLSPYASFQGADSSDFKAQYSYIINELKSLQVPLAYLHLVEARADPVTWVTGDAPAHGDKSLEFILEAWDNQSPVIVAGGYHPDNAIEAVEDRYSKWDVLVAFGRTFLANPDLVYRIKHGLELNPYDRPSFYTPKTETGYNDYPFSPEYLKSLEPHN